MRRKRERATDTFTAEELAARWGASVERIRALVARGVLQPVDERYEQGDVHRVRAIEAFEAAGVPTDVLVRAQEPGAISFAHYDQLHPPPGAASSRSYGEFRDGFTVERAGPATLQALGRVDVCRVRRSA